MAKQRNPSLAELQRRKRAAASTNKFPSWIPAHLDCAEKYRLLQAERSAVREADKKVRDAWSWKVPHEEKRAMPHEEVRQTLAKAYSTARAAAREDLRKRVMMEMEQATTKVDLPSHISRLSPGTVPSFIEGVGVHQKTTKHLVSPSDRVVPKIEPHN